MGRGWVAVGASGQAAKFQCFKASKIRHLSCFALMLDPAANESQRETLGCHFGVIRCILSDIMRIQVPAYFVLIVSLSMIVPLLAAQSHDGGTQQTGSQAAGPKPEDTEVWQPEPKIVTP